MQVRNIAITSNSNIIVIVIMMPIILIIIACSNIIMIVLGNHLPSRQVLDVREGGEGELFPER